MGDENATSTSVAGVPTLFPPEVVHCLSRLKSDPTLNDSHWFLIPAVLILLLLGFMDRRRNVCKTFCDGRPGLPRPLSFLNEPRNTWGILFAFGSATTNIALVIKQYFSSVFPVWAKGGRLRDIMALCFLVFLVYIISLVTSLICYPLFACMTSRHTLVGAITGLLYSAGWLGYQIYRLDLKLYCKHRFAELSTLPLDRDVIIEFPAVICSTLVLAKFSWKLFKCVRNRRFTRSLSEEYVKALLNRSSWTSEARNASVLKKIYHFLFKPVTGFTFPIALGVTAFVSVLLVFVTTLELAFYSSLFIGFFPNNTNADRIVTASVAVASLLTILSGLRCVYVMLMNYRRDMLRLYRGDRTFIPESLRNMPPQTYMVCGMQFIGVSLIGSFVGSVLAFYVLYWPVLFTLYVLYYLDQNDELHKLWPQLEWLIFPVSLMIIFKVQVMLVNKIFMQKRINVHDVHRPLAVDNRVVYDVFAFLMVFINASMGLFQVFRRIFVSVIYGVFLIARMDRSLLLSGYETLDSCYTSYIGMILVDVAHNHPVMRVFCRIVIDTMDTRTPLNAMTTENPTYAHFNGSPQSVKTTTLAKRRWFLAYTLLKNPDIRKFRVHGRNSVPITSDDVVLSEYNSQSTENLASESPGIRSISSRVRKCSVPHTFATNVLVGFVIVCCVILYAGVPVLWKSLWKSLLDTAKG